MIPTRIAIIGCGFWAHYQIAAWRELPDARIVALCDPDLARAQLLADRFGVPQVFADAATLLATLPLDAVDIITPVATHAPLAQLAIAHRVAPIIQKPMTPDLATAHALAQALHAAGMRGYVHENFRWQAPIRRLKTLLDASTIGAVFRARLSFCSAFPVFANQPALAQLDQFILMDIGTHVLDMARLLLGEANTITCHTHRVNPAIRGEDVATVLLGMRSGAHCVVELSYASRLEREAFPHTLVLVEGAHGSIRLGHAGELAVTTRAGTTHETVPIPHYDWVEPQYALVQSAIVACHRNILADLRGTGTAETTIDDNLRTLALVFGAYATASPPLRRGAGAEG